MAEPQPPPPPKSLPDLPDNLLWEILRLVPCQTDRGRMSLVCQAWRLRLRPLLPKRPRRCTPWDPRPLPWALHPSAVLAGSSRSSASVACVLTGYHRVHHFLTIIPRGVRLFGSHDAAWLFLAFRAPRRHLALNVRTGAIRDLPAELRVGDVYFHNMFIHAAALSAPPGSRKCVGATIVTLDPALPPHPRTVFWRKSWSRARDFETPHPDDFTLIPEDVIYHRRDFYFLTHGKHLLVCRLERLPNNEELDPQWEIRRFHPVGRYDNLVRASYLVKSRGEMLMVLRFIPEFLVDRPAWTSTFKVFRMTERQIPVAGAGSSTNDNDPFPVAEYPWAWSELDTLDGRILFVGHGCSRAYEADQYPAIKGGIYFLDDGVFYDYARIFGLINFRQYPCCDNGVWSEGRVERCFPRSDPSDHSPAAWLLP